MAIVDGTVTVTTAGTAVRLTSTSTLASWVQFHAATGNTGDIVVGASTVVGAAATRRGVVVPKQGTAPSTTLPVTWTGPLDLADIWFDSTDQAVSVQASRNRASARALF